MTDTNTASFDTSALGSTLIDGGCRFGLWAPRAERVELALVADDGSQVNHDMTRDEHGVWTVEVSDVQAGQRYGYRVHGPWDPDLSLIHI